MLFRNLLASLVAIVFSSAAAQAMPLVGSFFLTGHDPDFHAISPSGNVPGARKINQVAIDFILDPLFNPLVAGGNSKFLFVESKISPPGGHRNGVNGIV